MTGFRCKDLRHCCADKGCYLELLPSWDDIIERLPGAIRPTDIDGMVECSGHFLFIEEKSAGKALDEGQRKALMRQGDQPNTTVAVIRPVAGSVTGMQVLWFPKPNGFQDITRMEFLDWVGDWGNYARTNPPRSWSYELPEAEVNRLRRDNEMLRRQATALVDGKEGGRHERRDRLGRSPIR